MFVTVTPTSLDPVVSSMLQEGWVQIHELPDFTRDVEAVTTIAERASEVMVVDEESLIKVGPIRVKIRAREITKIHGYLEFFVEGVGYDAKFVPELPKKNIFVDTATQPIKDTEG